MNSENLDPEIANLLGINESTSQATSSPETAPPSFGKLFKDDKAALESTSLEEEAQRLQIIILTCHPERYRGLAGANFIDLEAIVRGAS